MDPHPDKELLNVEVDLAEVNPNNLRRAQSRSAHTFEEERGRPVKRIRLDLSLMLAACLCVACGDESGQ